MEQQEKIARDAEWASTKRCHRPHQKHLVFLAKTQEPSSHHFVDYSHDLFRLVWNRNNQGLLHELQLLQKNGRGFAAHDRTLLEENFEAHLVLRTIQAWTASSLPVSATNPHKASTSFQRSIGPESKGLSVFFPPNDDGYNSSSNHASSPSSYTKVERVF